MSLHRAGVGRFSRRAHEVAVTLWPGELLVDDVAYECACSGGRRFRELDEHGHTIERVEYHVRVSKEVMSETARPAIGTEVEWTPLAGAPKTGRVLAVLDRPQEAAWGIEVQER